MKENRKKAIETTLKWEGGYVNHPSDPGGATNFGITIADVRKYIKKDATPQDVKNITKDQAIQIYENKYWKTTYYDCDKLDSGVDLAVFDFGVNSGPSRAKKFLDQAVGGPASETVTRICDARLAWLKTLKTWGTFGTGWERRVKDIKKVSLGLAASPPQEVKGSVPAIKPKVEDGAAAGGIVAAISAYLYDPTMWRYLLLAGGVAIGAWVLVKLFRN
jgi:lysozyme family protein